MYIHGQLLFLGFIFDAHHRSAKDLLKEICRVRGDYRSGLRLPADHKYRYFMYSTANIHLIKCFQYVHIFSFFALFPVLLVILQQPQLLRGHKQEQVRVFTGFGSLMSYKQR